MSDTEPQGLCGIITVAVIESENGHYWSYTQTRLGMRENNKFCKGYEIGVPFKFSQQSGLFDISSCKMIEFK